jgi:spermidine/putrescine transport system ATP-binding protein
MTQALTPAVRFENVSKHFSNGTVRAVDGVTLDIANGEFFALLGPSGCGKSTLLRMIAGFETPTAGRVFVGRDDVTDLPPHKNPVNLVFQHYAVFPHLSVEQNVGFGLRYHGCRDRAQSNRRVDEALELVRLAGYGKRRPDQLSGGQRQRVALARALVLRPKVLLLDEPFGALDAKLRREMQIEMKELQRTLGITFIFVTHDQDEALTMSDRIAVMNLGRVEQCDTAERLFERPRTRFVAEFMGAANFMEAKVVECDGTSGTVAADTGFRCKADMPKPRAAGDRVTLVVRPEKLMLRLLSSAGPGLVEIPVVVEDRSYQGVSTVWTVRNSKGERLSVFEQNDEPPGERGPIAVGGKAWACWDPRHTVVLE